MIILCEWTSIFVEMSTQFIFSRNNQIRGLQLGMCVRVHAPTCAHVHACVCACMCVRTHCCVVCTHSCARMCKTQLCVCMRAYASVCGCMCACMCEYIHFLSVCLHVHVYVNVCSRLCMPSYGSDMYRKCTLHRYKFIQLSNHKYK